MPSNTSVYGNLAKQIPGRTQEALKGANQAAILAAQAGAGGSAMGRPQLGIPQQAQVLQQLTQQASTNQIGAIQQGAKEQVAVGAQAIDAQKQANQNALLKRKVELQRKEREANASLNTLNSSLKGNLFDKQQTFARDELGRAVFNDRQLLDWKIASAKSDNEIRDFEQKVRQESARKMATLQMAHEKVKQALEQNFRTGQQELDQAQLLELARAKAALEAKMKAEKNRARNRASIFTAAGTIVGGVVGFVYGGGPVGAAAGASIGGGVGSAVGGAVG